MVLVVGAMVYDGAMNAQPIEPPPLKPAARRMAALAMGLVLISTAASAQETLRTARQWSGDSGGRAEFGLGVATSQAGWTKLWRAMSKRPPPGFDAAGETAFAIYLGTRPTGGFGVKLGKLERSDGRVVVNFSERTPGPRFVIQIITTPYLIGVLEGANIAVGFRNTSRAGAEPIFPGGG